MRFGAAHLRAPGHDGRLILTFPTLLMINLRISPLLRRVTALSAVIAVTVMAACSNDRVVGPQADGNATVGAPRNGGYTVTADGTTAASVTKTALRWNKRLAKAVTRSFTVDSATGGTLEVASLGFTLTVPRGAIRTRSLTITVRAMAGNAVAYEFSPEGTQFVLPVIMKQDLNLTTWSSNRSFSLFAIGYFKSATQVNAETGAAVIDETLPALLAGSTLWWSASHFSGYMVSVD